MQFSQSPAKTSPNANRPIKWVEFASDQLKLTQAPAFLTNLRACSNAA